MGRERPEPSSTGAKKRTDWTLAYIIVAAVGLVALLALVTAPVAAILGGSEYAIPSALHGVSAMVYVVIATIAAYLALLMYMGRLEAYRDVRILAGLNSFFSLLTILFGNWIYIYYREPAGPRSYFLENDPAIHMIFFEFKEFIALFTLPLTVSAAFVLWTHRDDLDRHKDLRQATAVMIIMAWGCLMLAFGLGAAITKLRSV